MIDIWGVGHRHGVGRLFLTVVLPVALGVAALVPTSFADAVGASPGGAPVFRQISKGELSAGRENYVARAAALGSEIVVTARRSFGGSITSLVFRGKEYINADDKGRELQSASVFDELGECFNPTEAGGTYDKFKDSSSIVRSARAEGNVLDTVTDMAFWRLPGEVPPEGHCGHHPEVTTVQNRDIRGGHLLHKTVTIGYQGLPNVIQYSVTYIVPERHAKGRFEALSVHAPPDFSVGRYFDPAGNRLIPVEARAELQRLPVIMTTPDEKHAMALYCPDIPSSPKNRYGLRLWPQTSVSRCIFMEDDVAAGDYSYRGFIIVGTLAEVKASFARLAAGEGTASPRTLH